MTTPKLKAEVKAQGDAFAVTVNGKPLKTPNKKDWVCTSENLAKVAAEEVEKHGTKGAFYKLQSFVVDTPAETTQTEMLDHFDTDLVFYEADEPVDLVAFQKQHWEPVRTWLCDALGGVPFKISYHTTLNEQPKTTHEALEAYLKGLSTEQRAVAYFAGRLASSVAIGLAFAAKELDAEDAHKAGHADEYYQESRYKPDDLLTERFDENIKQFAQLQIFRDFSY